MDNVVHESGLMREELVLIAMRRVRNSLKMCKDAYHGKCHCVAYTQISGHQ